MDQTERDRLTAQIILGKIPIHLSGKSFYLFTPSLEDKYEAEVLYKDILEECLGKGILSEEEMTTKLMEIGYWTSEEEERLENIPDEIDNLKVELFGQSLKSDSRARTRVRLNEIRAEQDKLSNKKSAFSYLTAEGLAVVAKNKYLILSSILDKNKNRVWSKASWGKTNIYTDGAVDEFNRLRISESQFRALCQNDPWRSIWAAKKAGNIFSSPITELTDAQRNLILWSTMYDSIAEHPECPHSSIVEDDDMLDGWLIIQKRKREENANRKIGQEKITNEKIRRSDEIFIFAETIEDARKVEAMNDAAAKYVKDKKVSQVKNKGEINELELAEVKQRYQMEAAQKFAQSMRKK